MKKILLAEGSNAGGDNLKELLELSNYTVISAADGGRAMHMAIAEKPDLIIASAVLPVLDGYGIIYALRQYPRCRSIPVIILTTTAEKGDFRKAMTAGADDFLAKPFDGTELLKAVEACLRRRQRRNAGHADVVPGIAPSQRETGAADQLWHPGNREVRNFKRKTILHSEGQRALQVWYIVNGRVKTYLVNTDGKELVTRIDGPGDCVGYIAAIQGGVYTDNAQVLEDAGLIIIPRTEFMEILNSDSSLSHQLIKWLARNATEYEAGLVNLAYNSLRKKVANGILNLYDSSLHQQAGSNYITVSRDNLAAIVGAAPESLTRTLSDFKREKLIKVAEGKMYLLNEEKLRKMIN